MLQSLRTLLKSVPRLIIETLYFWTIRSGFLYIKVETDLDDGVVLEDHCDFIVKILGVILQSNMRHIEQDFTIDLRNFGNFQLQDCSEQNEEELMDLGMKVHHNICFGKNGSIKGNRKDSDRKFNNYENF